MSIADQVSKKIESLTKSRMELEKILPKAILDGSWHVGINQNSCLFIHRANSPYEYITIQDVKALYEFLQAYFEDRLPE